MKAKGRTWNGMPLVGDREFNYLLMEFLTAKRKYDEVEGDPEVDPMVVRHRLIVLFIIMKKLGIGTRYSGIDFRWPGSL